MKVSLNTIKHLVDFELPPVDELVARINAQLGGVEDVVDLGIRYKDAVIVKVVTAEKHPDADRLTVCMVDDSGVAGDVERDEAGLVQVICGAPNARADMWAVWLPPKSTVPSSFDDAEPFVLETRDIRGVKSNGMLAAGDELAINSDHDGIVDITERDLPSGKELKTGASFAELFGLDDYIIDIENKMFTHRPDLFGQMGVAREIAGIFAHEFRSPDWYLNASEFANADGLDLRVFNEAGDNVPRFMAVVMKNVEIGPSPLWLQAELVRWGSKAINNVVDLTNWIMLYAAQPTHAYDYDKLRGHAVGARMAKPGEELPLLNGKTYELTEDDIVIADGEGAIGLGGIMGGGNSEVSPETKNIVLEVANFDMYTLRKSSMRHGVFTDALTRFNKGQPPLQNDRVLHLLMEQMAKYAGGEQASNVYDLRDNSASQPNVIETTTEFINQRLGAKLDGEAMRTLLENVEVNVREQDAQLTIASPFWRTDLEQPEDIVEEVGRLYGFDKLPRELPRRSMRAVEKNASRELKQSLRMSLEKLGANEALTYSFVNEKIMKNAEQDVAKAFKLSNALSPDLQYYRLSVLPSLLGHVHMNIKAGHDEFVLYEIGKGHQKNQLDDEGLPGEEEMLDIVYASRKPTKGSGAPYFYMKRLVELLGLECGLAFRYEEIDQATNDAKLSPFEPSRSSRLYVDDTVVGVVGELKQSVIQNFKLPQYAAAASLDLARLGRMIDVSRQTYVPLSRFPSITQDLSLRGNLDVKYADVWSGLQDFLETHGELSAKILPVSIYRAEGGSEKTFTFRFVCTHPERTLTDKEVSELLDAAADYVSGLGLIKV